MQEEVLRLLDPLPKMIKSCAQARRDTASIDLCSVAIVPGWNSFILWTSKSN